MNTTLSNRALIDPHGRVLEYLRLSVTDRCDLRCSYCIPKGFKGFEEPKHWLTFDEIERLIGAFARLGLRRVRLTGGEPLLRKNVDQLAKRLSSLPGIEDLSLSTNGTQLSNVAGQLAAAGVNRINVSLDSLDKGCVETVAGRNVLEQVMDGLFAAKAAGIAPIKINMVVMKGVNDHEVDQMADFCLVNGFVLRFIEAMPMGETGQNTEFVSLQPIRERLVERLHLQPCHTELGGGPARYWQTADGNGQIGFITPLSQHFCATCNRVRLSVDGTLYLCLGQEFKYEFRPLLRSGATDAELEAAIIEAIALKPAKHDFVEQPKKILRFMSQTGG
ncbi:GTP 3',8-cyclase MoaA [Leeia sp. TBRC 13508]|uniref:GTP 3',8-cyclase n=1 Tax=Leeia speluncae TaxID=2884804 RepID=A0ABS8D8L6_9NEIS|nr:GTP 3',8-cyclase MoaA [Leeia speluncae]MCB6184567.1 GTP 3',8-cyclase MoaA [Leeia speluncae]